MMSETHADETLDTSTGEVLRRTVPIGPITEEPADLHDPVPYPFPGNSPVFLSPTVEEIQQPDPYKDTPDPDVGDTSLSSLSRKRNDSLQERAMARGRHESDTQRCMGDESQESSDVGRISLPVAVNVPEGLEAKGPVDQESLCDTYYPPTEQDIYGAAATGITGSLSQLWDQTKNCNNCALCETRRQVVLGSGNSSPTYVFVGQAPGPNEDQQGGPFVGPAGEELTAVLNSVEINRVTECYLMNTVCCRPIDSVTGRVCPPSINEMAACRPRLANQLRALIKGGDTKVIVLLGKEAYVDFFYKSEVEAGTFNLKSFRVGPKIGWQDMRKRSVPSTFPKVYFTYHPSYIMRNGGTACQDYPAWRQDFMAIKRWCADGLFTKPRGQEILA